MSVILVTGKPGSGKSLSLNKIWVLPSIRKIGTPLARKVYTNIAGLSNVNLSYVANKKYAHGDCFYSPDEIDKMFVLVPPSSYVMEANKVIMSMPPGSLLIVDEAQKYWNNRDFKSEANKQILEYFTEHRRRGHDVVLATQSYEQVDIGIRRLCEAHYSLSRMKKIGFASVVKVLVYDQGLDMEKSVGRETWRIDKSIFRCYSSYEGGAQSEIVYKGPNIFLSNYKLIFLAVVFLSMLLKFLIFGKKPAAPEDYIGSFADYFCVSNYIYVLRANETVDTVPVKKVPFAICPRVGYQHSVHKKLDGGKK